MEYIAKANIGVPGYGRVTPGEYLDEKCKAVLGEEAISDLVRRGALKVEAGIEPKQNGSEEQSEAPEEAPEEITDAPEGAGDEEEGAEELEPDTMDDVVDEAEEPEAAPDEKPKKNSRGRKAK